MDNHSDSIVPLTEKLHNVIQGFKEKIEGLESENSRLRELLRQKEDSCKLLTKQLHDLSLALDSLAVSEKTTGKDTSLKHDSVRRKDSRDNGTSENVAIILNNTRPPSTEDVNNSPLIRENRDVSNVSERENSNEPDAVTSTEHQSGSQENTAVQSVTSEKSVECSDSNPLPVVEGPHTPNGRGLGVDKVTFLSGMELGNTSSRLTRTRSCEELSEGSSRRKIRARRFYTPAKRLGEGLTEEDIQIAHKELDELAQHLARDINKAREEGMVIEQLAEKASEDPAFSEILAMTLETFDLQAFLKPAGTNDSSKAIEDSKSPPEVTSSELLPYPEIHFPSVDCNIVMGELDASGNCVFMSHKSAAGRNPLCLPTAPSVSTAPPCPTARYRNIAPKFGKVAVMNAVPVVVMTPLMPPPKPVPPPKLTKRPKRKQIEKHPRKEVPPTVEVSTPMATPGDMPSINFFATPSLTANPAPITPIPATPEVVTPQSAPVPPRQSNSTPRRKSHIRALEFETPPKSFGRRRSTSSPKTRRQCGSSKTPEDVTNKTTIDKTMLSTVMEGKINEVSEGIGGTARRRRSTSSPKTRRQCGSSKTPEDVTTKTTIDKTMLSTVMEGKINEVKKEIDVTARETPAVKRKNDAKKPSRTVEAGEGQERSEVSEDVERTVVAEDVQEVEDKETPVSTLPNESSELCYVNETVVEVAKGPPIATLTPGAKRPSSAWDSVAGVNCIFGQGSNDQKVLEPWDAYLRKNVCEEDPSQTTKRRLTPSTKPRRKIQSTKRKAKRKVSPKKKKRTKPDPNFSRATRSKSNITVSPSKMNATSKRNTYSISECSSVDGDPLMEKTPAKDAELSPYSKHMNKLQRCTFGVSAVDTPGKLLSQEDTPFSKLLRENVPSVDIDLSMITTPSFPETPLVMLNTPLPSRPTDYSSSSSYYKPDLTSPGLKDLDVPSLQRSEEQLQDVSTSSGRNLVMSPEPVKELARSPVPKSPALELAPPLAKPSPERVTGHDKSQPEQDTLVTEGVSSDCKESSVETVESTTERINAVVIKARQVAARTKIPGKNMSFLKFQMLAQCERKLCDNIVEGEKPSTDSVPKKSAADALREELEIKKRNTVEKLKQCSKRPKKQVAKAMVKKRKVALERNVPMRPVVALDRVRVEKVLHENLPERPSRKTRTEVKASLDECGVLPSETRNAAETGKKVSIDSAAPVPSKRSGKRMTVAIDNDGFSLPEKDLINSKSTVELDESSSPSKTCIALGSNSVAGESGIEPNFSHRLVSSTPCKVSPKSNISINSDVMSEFPKFVDDGQHLELPINTRKKMFLAKAILEHCEVKQFQSAETRGSRQAIKRGVLEMFSTMYKWLKHPRSHEKESTRLRDWIKVYMRIYKKIMKEIEWTRSEESSSDVSGAQQLPPKKRKTVKEQQQQVDTTVAQSLLQNIDVDSFLSQVHGQQQSPS